MAEYDRSIFTNLEAAPAQALTDTLAAIRAEFQTLKNGPHTAETLASLRSFQADVSALNAELQRRDTLTNDVSAAFSDLETQTAPTPVVVAETPAAPAPVEPAPAAPAPVAVAPVAPAAPAPAAPAPVEPAPIVAAGRQFGTTGAPEGTTEAPALPQVIQTTTFAGGIDGVAAGSRADRVSAMRAFTTMHRAIATPGGSGQSRHTVLTQTAVYPEERRLSLGAGSNDLANTMRIDKVVNEARSVHAMNNKPRVVARSSRPEDPMPLVAAGGLCGPLEVLYDISTIGDTGRPGRDSLLRFQVPRGGITYRPAVSGVAQTAGIGQWTNANDIASPLVPKTCGIIDCIGPVSAQIYSVYECLIYQNMSMMFDPEFFDATTRAQQIAHDRIAENLLYTGISAGSKTVESLKVLGAARDILATLDHLLAYYRNVHRYSQNQPMRWWLPMWAANEMAMDIMRQMPGDGMETLSITQAQVDAWFAARNVNVTWFWDGTDPADLITTNPLVIPNQAYTLIPNTGNPLVPLFPAVIDGLLFAEGDWLFLDGGELNVGLIRDSALNLNNQVQVFSETFEGLAFRGIESLHTVIQTAPNGATAATVSTTGIVG